MDPLIIEPTSVTPRIVFDPRLNKFEISEQSLPEDALAFYLPVTSWLKEYGKGPNPDPRYGHLPDCLNSSDRRYTG